MEEVPDATGGQTLEEVVQSGCGESICGDSQNPTGLGPGQPTVWTVLGGHGVLK